MVSIGSKMPAWNAFISLPVRDRLSRVGISSLILVAGCHGGPRLLSARLPKASPRTTVSSEPEVHGLMSGLVRQVGATEEKEVSPEEKKEPATDKDRSESKTDNRPVKLAKETTFPATPRSSQLAALQLDTVVDSVYDCFPLLRAAIEERRVAAGEIAQSLGAFDLKLKAASENNVLGFYQNYRQRVGFEQPTYNGGEFFGGYRIGRGSFEPWYLERQTNEGGEFKAGFVTPLARNRPIDPRRANLQQANLERLRAEPEIQAELIAYVQAASHAYWEWVAAGRDLQIAERVLELATDRSDRIKEQVDAGFVDPPEYTDNQRLVAERQAKSADARRKLAQKSAKLSLYYRDSQGNPLLPTDEMLGDFPALPETMEQILDQDISLALSNRPETRSLDLLRRQYEVQLRLANNDLQPEIDALLAGSQDVGEPTSSKRDKSEFEAEAALYFELPAQRRKARGKITTLCGKLAQIDAKRQIVQDKIVVDVRLAFAAMTAAREQVKQTTEAVRFAEDLAQRERANFNEGASDLLKVTLREQYAAESASKQVEALLLYFAAEADYRAALAIDGI
jgi:outer membrane protein TolC